MSEFIGLVKVLAGCGTVLFIAMLVLLSLPQCRLRSVGVELMKWLTAAGLVFLTVSPIDVIPDVVPLLGWGDDLGYLLGAFTTARSAMSERRRRVEMDN